MSTIQQWLNESLEKIDHAMFKDVVSVDVELKSMDDGQVVLISEIKRVNLKMTTSKGQEKQLKAISKFEAKEGPGKQLATDTGAFTTEIKMYSSILKSMEMIMSESGDKDYVWPECYYCADNKFLLQDLCEIGYKIVPVYKLLTVDHALLIMKGIGKFHGLSMVMADRGILDTSDEKPPFFVRPNPFLENMQKKSIESFIQAVKDGWGQEWLPITERMEKYFDKINEKLFNVWTSTKGKLDVLNHGDFSMRNMLFHYNRGSSNPDSVKFVDFQMCHISNFGFDLASILYSSMHPKVRDENLDELLRVYTDSLVSTCKLYGFKGPLPTLKDIQETLKTHHLMSTLNVIFTLPFLIQSDQQDVQKKADEFMESFSEDGMNKPMNLIDYKAKKVADVLKDEIKRCINEKLF